MTLPVSPTTYDRLTAIKARMRAAQRAYAEASAELDDLVVSLGFTVTGHPGLPPIVDTTTPRTGPGPQDAIAAAFTPTTPTDA